MKQRSQTVRWSYLWLPLIVVVALLLTIVKATSHYSHIPVLTSVSHCYSPSDARPLIGHTGCVAFTGYAYTSPSGQMYLDQSTAPPYGFSVYIPAGSSFGRSLLTKYSGQPIQVTGFITSYAGELEIEVTSAAQVRP
jgi:hypothetical protein